MWQNCALQTHVDISSPFHAQRQIYIFAYFFAQMSGTNVRLSVVVSDKAFDLT